MASDAELQQLIDESRSKGSKLFVEFGAAWCDHCKGMIPTMSDLAHKNKRHTFAVADVFHVGSDKEQSESFAFASIHFVSQGFFPFLTFLVRSSLPPSFLRFLISLGMWCIRQPSGCKSLCFCALSLSLSLVSFRSFRGLMSEVLEWHSLAMV